MVRAGLGYLSCCDAAELGTAAQAEALIGLEQAGAQHTAARAKMLAAFSAQQGHQADGQYGPAAWLRAFTRITPGRWFGGEVGPPPGRASADRCRAGGGQLSSSWARALCEWADQLPKTAARTRALSCWPPRCQARSWRNLGALAQQMIERSRTAPTVTRAPLMTGRCGWKPPSAGRGG